VAVAVAVAIDDAVMWGVGVKEVREPAARNSASAVIASTGVRFTTGSSPSCAISLPIPSAPFGTSFAPLPDLMPAP